MSRIGKQPIKVPSGVTVSIDPDFVSVNGSKGSLKQFRLAGIDITQEGDIISVTRRSDEAEFRAKHGLMRSLVANMIEGVSKGFEKRLEVNGVGFKVAQSGDGIKLNLGFSHDVNYKLPAGVTTKIDSNLIIVSGIDKQQVGQVAAEIRSLKKPEPYKGKGIKYVDERVLRKSGKSGKEK